MRTGGVGQTNFDPLLDINEPGLEYQRADYDATHVFNFNAIYELPFETGALLFLASVSRNNVRLLRQAAARNMSEQ
jgi:hypothetical protein